MSNYLKLLETNLFLVIIVGFLALGGLRLLLEEAIAVIKLAKQAKRTIWPKARAARQQRPRARRQARYISRSTTAKEKPYERQTRARWTVR